MSELDWTLGDLQDQIERALETAMESTLQAIGLFVVSETSTAPGVRVAELIAEALDAVAEFEQVEAPAGGPPNG